MLVLRLVRRTDGVTLRSISRPVEAAGLTIGRAAECDVVLDDPLRLVSRRHAWIAPHGAHEAVLQCVSTSAALRVNGETLPPGAECLIVDGDHIAIGAFELTVEALVPVEATLIELGRHVAPQSPPPVPAAPSAAAPSAAAPSALAAAPPAFRSSRLDQWFDLDTVADPLGPGSPLAPLEAAAAPPTALPVRERRVAPGPPAALHQQPPPATPAPASAAPTPPSLPPAPAASPGTFEPPSVPAMSEPGSELLALRQAFLRGAGLGDGVPLGPDPAWAAHAGALLRSLTEETFELLRTRAVTKENIRAEGTRIVARENNPLKFAPDASACLRLLLQQQARPGFLDPLDALREAHEDLQLHQIAMVAGMRAAVAELILRLGPVAVEQAAAPSQGLARWLPWWREAILWRRHRQTHAALVAGLDDAFDAAFGREFLLAYEAQARRVRSRPDAGDGARAAPP